MKEISYSLYQAEAKGMPAPKAKDWQLRRIEGRQCATPVSNLTVA